MPTARCCTIANRMFTDKAFEPSEDYRVALATYFGAGAEPAPLATNGEASAKQINGWISKKTNGLIKDLVKAEAFSPDSRLMLANTVYMKADWDEPFEHDDTHDGTFTRLDGSTRTVKMMHQTETTGEFARGDGWVAATKAYLDGDTEMLVILPDEGRFAEVEDDLPSVLGEVDDSLVETGYLLALPKFTATSATDLREVMESRLGVDGLFGVVGLDGIGKDLYIDSAAHAVKVIVDETGTEAAAATVIGMDATGAIVAENELVADHPFIYVIRDTETGAIEFVGRVLDPSAQVELQGQRRRHSQTTAAPYAALAATRKMNAVARLGSGSLRETKRTNASQSSAMATPSTPMITATMM